MPPQMPVDTEAGAPGPGAPRPNPRGESFADLFDAIVTNIERVIQGKRDVIRLMLVCLLAEGHLLVEDAPGVGKTSLGKALAKSLDVTFGRIQFTPDLLPTDVVGVSLWNRSSNTFEFRPGPIFAGLVLADEINRTSPKTQAALLEAMAERQVTVDGATHTLPRPFMVIATQNPIEHEGTYPLPDSQLDRFLMTISVGYPSREAELEILETHATGDALDDLRPVVSAQNVIAMTRAVKKVHVAPAIKTYLVEIANTTRQHPHLTLGMSPRATLALQRAARSRAAAVGRGYVTPDDVKALAEPVLAHRLLLRPEARMRGGSNADVVAEVLQRVPVPRVPAPT
ncbi:MAG: MoxR family ATPase [Acidimicrobiales bacterium]